MRLSASVTSEPEGEPPSESLESGPLSLTIINHYLTIISYY